MSTRISFIINPDSINNMHFAVFFGHEKPEDIGISGALSAYSNEVLAAVFNLDPTLFDKLPKLEEDVFVVTEQHSQRLNYTFESIKTSITDW
jgi:hypothetical protein